MLWIDILPIENRKWMKTVLVEEKKKIPIIHDQPVLRAKASKNHTKQQLFCHQAYSNFIVLDNWMWAYCSNKIVSIWTMCWTIMLVPGDIQVNSAFQAVNLWQCVPNVKTFYDGKTISYWKTYWWWDLKFFCAPKSQKKILN